MKNIDDLYKKYYNTYKSDYDTDVELNDAKKKNFDCKQFELVDKTDKELKLDEETKDLKLTALPKWLSSKMILMKWKNRLTILEMIQTMSSQVLGIKKFLMIREN